MERIIKATDNCVVSTVSQNLARDLIAPQALLSIGLYGKKKYTVFGHFSWSETDIHFAMDSTDGMHLGISTLLWFMPFYRPVTLSSYIWSSYQRYIISFVWTFLQFVPTWMGHIEKRKRKARSLDERTYLAPCTERWLSTCYYSFCRRIWTGFYLFLCVCQKMRKKGNAGFFFSQLQIFVKGYSIAYMTGACMV